VVEGSRPPETRPRDQRPLGHGIP